MNPYDRLMLTETDLHLIRMHGHVEVIDDITVSRVPDNPGYRWGNCIHLPRPPAAEELDNCIQLARDLFVDQPESRHVQVRWDGGPIEPSLVAQANTMGLHHDDGQMMHATELMEVRIPGIDIRPLDLKREWSDIVALNIACDPEEIDGQPDYIAFKEGIRRAWRAWVASGAATWWGAFIKDQLVGQAGMVVCPDGRGRYQSVETHPDFRRRGICPALVSHMGQHALSTLGCNTLVLGANPRGLAIHIYSRLGFITGDWQHALSLLPD